MELAKERTKMDDERSSLAKLKLGNRERRYFGMYCSYQEVFWIIIIIPNLINL
jgi:hypothetical protein